MLFDAHCHLQVPAISKNLFPVMKNWQNVGGTYLICCGSEENDWQDVINISRQHPLIVPCLGVHPWYMDGLSETWDTRLAQQLEKHQAAMGEIGLDFAVKHADREKQELIFARQLELAKEMNLPVNIHVRKAWEALIRHLKTIGPFPAGGLIHSYSGSAEMISILQQHGFMISFSGSITYPGNKKGVKALKAVSPDHILIETDSPDIIPRCPEPVSPSFNVPENLVYVAKTAAAILEIPLEELVQRTFRNGHRLYERFLKTSP